MAFLGEATVSEWTLIHGMAWNQLRGRHTAAVDCGRALGTVTRGKILVDKTALPRHGQSIPAVVMLEVEPADTGAPMYLVSVTGTNTAYQWLLHFIGSPPLPFSGGDGTVHSFFRAAARELWPQVKAFVGPARDEGRNPKVVFVGHSLGGGVATALLNLADRDGYKRVSAYTGGAPAVGNQRFVDAVNDRTWRLVTDGDPVPSVPPTVDAGKTSWFGLGVALGPYSYRQPSQVSTLHEDGTITPGSAAMSATAVVRTLTRNRGVEHVPSTYLARLGPAFLTPANLAPGAGGFADPYRLARLLADALPEVPEGSVPPPVPPRVVKDFPADPPGSPGPLPVRPPALTNRGLGAHMGTPALAKNPPAYRVLLKFNMGLWGWSEEYLLWYTAPTFADAEKDAAKLATARRKILDDQASIFGYRVQEYGGDGPHGSEFISDSARGCGPGDVDSFDNDNPFLEVQTEPVWDTLLVSFSDDSRQYRRNLMLRGLPAEYVTWRKNGDPGLTDEGTGPVTAFVQGLLGGADPANPNAGLLAGKLAIYGRSHDKAQTGRLDVVRAAINPVCGTDVITRPGQALSWNRGDTVHVHQAGCDQCHVNGMSGDTCVLDTGTNDDGTLTTTVGRRPCCCGPQLVLPSDTTIELVKKAFYLVTGASVGRLTSRATGAPFGAGRGRARSCARR